MGDSDIRQGRAELLRSVRELDLVWQGENGLRAIEELPEITVDVVLVDVRIRGISGTDFIQRYLRRHVGTEAQVPRFVLTAPFPSPELAIAAVRAGATDFVSEEEPVEDLVNAIREAKSGDTAADFRELAEFFESIGVTPGSQPRWHLRLGELPEREARIFTLLTEGHSESDLPKELGIPAMSVRAALANLMRGLGLATKVQLALAVFEAGRLKKLSEQVEG